MRIEDVWPVHLAGYIEQLQALRKAPTVKQHLTLKRIQGTPRTAHPQGVRFYLVAYNGGFLI